MSDINEALEYFKKREVYKKLFLIFKKKYESLGKAVGTASLTGLTKEERNDLSGFLMKDYSDDEEVKISAKLFEKALLKSKFSELNLEDILVGYFGKELRTKKEKNEEAEVQKEEYLSELKSNTGNDYIKDWLQKAFYEKIEGSNLIIKNYNSDREKLRDLLLKLINAITQLPYFVKSEKKELLAVFAAKTTGNPHFFDDDTIAQSFLIAFLKDYYKYEYETDLSEAENKSGILYKSGLIKDSLSNDVIAYGIRGHCMDGSLHKGLEGYFDEKEPVKLSLLTLSRLKEALIGDNLTKIYIVENPAVFSYLISYFPDRAFICSYGQIRRAVFMLLDLFDKNITFSYAGDFDPEGLLIADRLKKRYGERLELWNYEAELYTKYISDEVLSETRIKKLERVSDVTLVKIAELMRKERRAAYQENMLEEYLRGDAEFPR